MMSLLTGKALDWASAVWDHNDQLRTSFDYFSKQVREVFEYPAGGRDVSLQLRQGNRSAADYAVEFRTLAAQSGWNEVALKPVFKQGLSHTLQAELACKDVGSDLSQLISMAIKVDNLQRNNPPGSLATSNAIPAINIQEPAEPMQIGFTKVSMEERERRRVNRLCFYCGQPGHQCRSCPSKPAQTKVSTPLPMMLTKCFSLLITLAYTNSSQCVPALIDSGSALNLIHHELVHELK